MRNGKPLNTKNFNAAMKKYCLAANVPYLYSHKICFTNASLLYHKGMTLVQLQKLLGHTTSEMTQKYLKEVATDNKDGEQMNEILG